MTGIERLRKLAGDYKSLSTKQAYIGINTRREADLLDDIADQIEREQEALVRETEDVAGRDGDALAWVEEHGGLEAVKAHWSGRVALSHVHNMAERHKAKVARMQRHIEHVQGVCKTRAHRIVEMNKTIAEMRPRLMPEGMEWLVEAWPRFEDGEPVRLLDDFERYGEENGVSAVTMYADGSFALNCRAYSKGERVNRPAPKVLDADGAEIRVGDTVWTTRDLSKFIVTNPNNGMFLSVSCKGEDGEDYCCYPTDLTHRAPVLAGDGKPLREGEHVWHVETGTELVVKELPKPGAYQAVVVFAPPASHLTSFDPDQLTHERPDSWERLEEDSGKNPFDYCKDVGHRLDTCENSEAYKARDLVRRARALAGRDAS